MDAHDVREVDVTVVTARQRRVCMQTLIYDIIQVYNQ